MKRIIHFISIIALVLVLGSCSQKLYPGQSESDRKEVPKAISYFTRVPKVRQVNDMKYIHDVSNNAFVLFKGAADSTLEKMQNWLPYDALDEDSMQRKPVAKYVMTPIGPYTLFTKEELRSLSKKEKKQVVTLARYRTYGITIEDFTYVDLLTDKERNVIYNIQNTNIPAPKTEFQPAPAIPARQNPARTTPTNPNRQQGQRINKKPGT